MTEPKKKKKKKKSALYVWNTNEIQRLPDNMSRSMTKPIKWHVRPVKTQISLCIRPVWWESSPSAWICLGSLAIHSTQRRPWSDWALGGSTQSDLSLRWVLRTLCLFCHAAAYIYRDPYHLVELMVWGGWSCLWCYVTVNYRLRLILIIEEHSLLFVRQII